MKTWIKATCFCIAVLCLMSWLDDGYAVQVAANQELIEAQKAARLELADRKMEEAYLLAKAGNITGVKVVK